MSINSDVQQICDYLEQVSQIVPSEFSDQKLVLRYGVPFSVRVPSPYQGSPKSCFENCVNLSRQHHELTYCEGYATWKEGSFPLLHSWLVNPQGEVIDPTWKYEGGELYFGIAFNLKFVIECLRETKQFGIINSDYKRQFILHQQGFPGHALAPQFHTSTA